MYTLTCDYNEGFTSEIDGEMFTIIKIAHTATLDNYTKITRTHDNHVYVFELEFINGDYYVYDISEEIDNVTIPLDIDKQRTLCEGLNFKHAPILTDIYTYQKDKHDMGYFNNMLNQKHDITGLPVAELIFRPVSECRSDYLDGRLIFKIK